MFSSLKLIRISSVIASRRVLSTKIEPVLDKVLVKKIENENKTEPKRHWTIRSSPLIGAGGLLQWSDVKELAEIVDKPEITGAILPFAEQNIVQKILAPFTYSIMYYMDALLTYAHLPWWLAIVGTTATFRILMFPLFVKQNRVATRAHNVLPETQKIQVKINEALCCGDQYTVALQKTKLALLYKEQDITIKQRLWPILVQAPIFLSMFILLRKLSSYPVEGLATGGTLWFSNLTIMDPFLILPALACVTFYIQLEYGTEFNMDASVMGPIGRTVFRAMPLVVFAATYSFPAAMLLFWTTNNFFSLAFALSMKQSTIRALLKIPPRLKHDPKSLPLARQTFSNQIKTAVDQSKASKTTLDVRRLDDLAFRKAGVGPLRKTYKTPPNEQKIK